MLFYPGRVTFCSLQQVGPNGGRSRLREGDGRPGRQIGRPDSWQRVTGRARPLKSHRSGLGHDTTYLAVSPDAGQ